MDKLTARRNLLKGTLSAPIVLTVSSASAQTVTSFGKCIANNGNSQPTATYVSNTDGWYRIAVTVYGIYKGNPTSGMLQGYFFKDGSGLYHSVTPTSYALWNGTGIVAAPYQVDGGHPWWQLVWYDSNGQPVGTGWQNPNSGLAATLSCQLSFG